MDSIAAQLREHGLKATPARIAILTLFTRTRQPLRIEEIHAHLQSKMNPATIYRSINALKAATLITQVDFGQPQAFFELAEREHHHHIVCEQCGRIADFIDCLDANSTRRILRRTPQFKRITRHSFELFGICTQCCA